VKASTAIGILLALAAVAFALGLINMSVPMGAPPVYLPEPTATTR
jgi:hypothetical protein